MSVFGISAFVDGLFKGRQFRDGQEDRKFERDRQKRMDAITEAREQRAVQDHQLGLKERGLGLQERGLRLDAAGLELDEARRAAGNEAAYRDLSADLMSNPGGAAPPAPNPAAFVPAPSSEMGAVSVSTSGQGPAAVTPGAAAAQGVASNLGLELTMADAAQPRPVQIPQGLGAVGSTAAPVAAQQGPTIAAAQGTPNPRARYDELTARIAEFERLAMPKTWREPSPQSSRAVRAASEQLPALYAEREKLAETLKAARIKELGPNYDHQWGGAGGLLADAGEAITRGNAAVDAINDAALSVPAYAAGSVANAVNRITNPWTGYIAGVEAPLNDFGAMGPEGTATTPPAAQSGTAAGGSRPTLGASPVQAAASDQTPDAALQPASSGLGAPPSAALGPRRANAPAEKVPAMKQEAQAAASVGGPAAAVAVAAAQNVKGEPLGAPGAGKLTEAQVGRASSDAMEHYTKVVAPQLIEEMLKRGDVDRALKYQDFIDQAATKAAMKDWSAAMVAAVDGNMDVFADKIITVYNRLDYYGDNTTILREKSGFTKDAQGNINGAILTFKDETTGNTWEQILDDPEQFVTMGIAATAPEKAFEVYEARIMAAKEGARGAAKERKQGLDDLAKLIFTETTKGALTDEQKITYAEAMQQAQEQIDGPSQAETAAAPPPLLRRP